MKKEKNQGFKIGELVITKKGDRMGTAVSGFVYGFGKWRHYPTLKIKTSDGRKTTILVKNAMYPCYPGNNDRTF